LGNVLAERQYGLDALYGTKGANMSEERWWHNLPQCKVGDLVIFKRKKAAKAVGPMLVVEVNPEKPCRAHPCQSVVCINDDGEEGTFGADRLEVISENR